MIMIVAMIAALCALVVPIEAAPQNSQITGARSTTMETQTDSESVDAGAYPFHRLITSGPVILYQKLISPGRGLPCPMHPHCSEYCREAFANHNPLRAYAMTADRLLRCGQDLNQYRRTTVDGHLRYFDPISIEQTFAGHAISFGATGQRSPVDNTDNDALPSVERAVSTPGCSDSLLYRFARQRQQDDDYDRAITEYLRMVSYYPDSRYSDRAKLAAMQCYYESSLYPEAIAYGRSVLSKRLDATIADQVRFLVGASKFKSGEFELALSDFTDLAEADGELQEKGVMAQGMTHAHLYDWTAAAVSFGAINDASDLSMNARRCARLSQEAADLGYRSPKVAGLLAIVPGLGYLYDGYYSTAMSAFMVNGLFMYSTYEAFRNDNNGLGVTLALFGMGWYTGNIYGSIQSAVRQNDKRRHDHLLKFDLGFRF